MATWLSGISKQHRTIRKNIFVWYGIFVIAFALVLLRLAWLQIIEHAEYRTIAQKLHTREVLLRAKRGNLLDRNGQVLALDDYRQVLYADPSLMPYPEFTARELAPILQMPEAELLDQFTQRTIKSNLPQTTAERIEAMSLRGIHTVSTGTRLRVGVNLQEFPKDELSVKKLAKGLNIPEKQVREELGDMTTAATGERWLRYIFSQRSQSEVAKQRVPGIRFQEFESYKVTVDQRRYQGKRAVERAEAMAEQLAPILGMKQGDVAGILRSRLRYTVLHQDLSADMLAQAQQRLGTLYVVEPGRFLDEKHEEDAQITSTLEEAVTRLDDMLNPKPKKLRGKVVGKTPPPLVPIDEIRRRLMPGAQPGAMTVKLDKDRQPDITIPRRLYARPIPGVMYGLPGIAITQEPRRHYPYGTLASATLGWVGDVRVNPHGVFGIEGHEDDLLSGVNGREVKEIDGLRRTIPERSRRTEPVDGLGVKLTLDLTIQQAAEEELAKAVHDWGALQGQCVVLDPKSGEILALATYPNWDANTPGKTDVALLNPAISNFYEPGSTFKVVAVMAALEEGLIRDGQQVTNCVGSIQVGRRKIGEAHGRAHGPVDCNRLLQQSCNIGAATLALQLNTERFLNWCEKLGFGQRTGLELAGESPGNLNRSAAKTKITLANMGFGQSLAVTPVQMAAAYAVFANSGEWIQPHLVKARQQKDGSWQDTTAPKRPVCSSETAQLLLKYLESVVEEGTGKRVATIEGYRVGGKTGTAQKPMPGIGYRSGKYIGSFIGVMPIDDPRLVIIAVIDEPTKSIYGGTVAGPVVREVGRRALEYLSIPPTLPIKDAAPAPH